MLNIETFRSVVKHTPLVSIDICAVCNQQMLLGKRNFEPLKDRWFTPGGRIFKNESFRESLARITRSELGFNFDDFGGFKLMGVWDHFYDNSFVDKNISTHYINLPHYYRFSEKPILFSDRQHNDLAWFDLNEITEDEEFHEYTKAYASWLINADIQND